MQIELVNDGPVTIIVENSHNLLLKILNMNYKVLAIFFLFRISLFSKEQDVDRYSISILTVSPGKKVADTFGHSGIRVIDGN